MSTFSLQSKGVKWVVVLVGNYGEGTCSSHAVLELCHLGDVVNIVRSFALIRLAFIVYIIVHTWNGPKDLHVYNSCYD